MGTLGQQRSPIESSILLIELVCELVQGDVMSIVEILGSTLNVIP